ncbi:MAG TPA: alpha-amylase family protein [Chloroflexota bacterium]|nr:alpha-amylase family protein [Chloroflexota bacterium]
MDDATNRGEASGTQWWHKPFRIFQTNIREVDSGLDVERNVRDILDFGCTVWLLNAGGIVSHYPSKLPHQHPSPWLKERPSGDLLRDAVEVAHRNGVRVLARCDFSKLHRDQFEAHPDWFYVSPKGERQIYNGLYSACPSGPYYQEKSLEVVGEILDGYAVDGFFFNMFGMALRDYSGNYHGICQCVNCQRGFAAFSGGMTLPREESYADAAYPVWRRYTRQLLDGIAGRVRAYIKSRRSDVCLLLNSNPDVTFHEINNAVDRPLPLWRYHAGEAAKTSRSAHPERPVAINCVMFWDIPYRFNAEQPGMVQLSLAQVIANGANPYAYVLGHTANQPDRKNFGAVRRMMRFHQANERWYGGLQSAAEVLVVAPQQSEGIDGEAGTVRVGSGGALRASRALRGVYRALAESHIPFDVLPDARLETAAADGRLSRYRAIVLPNAAVLSDAQVALLDRYVEQGGGVVATFETATRDAEGRLRPEWQIALQSLGAARVLARRDGFKELRGSYLRVTRRDDLPDLPDTDLVPVDRAFLYVEARQGAEPSFSFIGPTRYGPPEKCWWDAELETSHPGLLWQGYGQGRTAYFPWPVDALFFDHSLMEWRSLLATAVTAVAGGRQLQTDLPHQVEVTVNHQPASGATLLHLVNGSGHQDRSYFEPAPFFERTIALRTERPVQRVTAASLGQEVPFEQADGQVRFTLPRLELLELIVLE